MYAEYSEQLRLATIGELSERQLRNIIKEYLG